MTPATEGGGAKRHRRGATRRPRAHPRVHARAGEGARGGAAISVFRPPLSLTRWGLETVEGAEKRKGRGRKGRWRRRRRSARPLRPAAR
ncbi:unknown protein [Oryza sativa Japonica Group]|uniref:Uncharacterized protein n=1 Tax=Oryza sativa subsp. japonica TaxID=39947 RepID=Q5JKQ5_ORYSJ|nr:unknown protein [Oryza sativa Japonica Group]